MEHSNPAKSQTQCDILDGLASLSYLERLTKFIRGSTKHWVIGGVTVIDLRPLYAVTVHNLQRHLAEEIHKVDCDNITEQQLEKIGDLLNKYSGDGPSLDTLTQANFY